jgi:hypothetical protein
MIPTLRSNLTSAVSQHLAPKWPRRPGICFIRRLSLQVRITVAELESGHLSIAFAIAFAEALTLLLERSRAPEPADIVRFETRGAYLSQFVTDILAGIAAARWEYEELWELLGGDAVDAIVVLFEREPLQFLPVLRELERHSTLESVLARIGEYGIERLLIATASTSSQASPELSIADLIRVAKAVLALESSSARLPAVTRAHALHVYLHHAANSEVGAQRLSPRQVLNCLKILEFVLKHLAGAAAEDWTRRLNELPNEGGSDRVVSRDSAVISKLRSAAGSAESAILSELLKKLARTSPAAPEALAEQTISSKCAGLFFLVRYLLHDGWPTIVLQCAGEPVTAARELQLLLATLGLEALGRGQEVIGEMDAGLALFAGWSGDPDLTAFREFRPERAPILCSEMKARLTRNSDQSGDESDAGESPVAWLTRRYLQQMQQEIPGLRQASREFLVENTLALSGRIRIASEVLTLELPTAPFHVALHIGGLDQALDEVPWLGGRGIRFELEGL